MMALVTRVSRQGVLRAPRATKWEGTPYPLTLAEARFGVKKSRGLCCAIANGPLIRHSAGYTAGSAISRPMEVFILSPLYLAKTLSAVHTVTLFVLLKELMMMNRRSLLTVVWILALSSFAQ